MKKYELFAIETVGGVTNVKRLGKCRHSKEAEAMALKAYAKETIKTPEQIIMVPAANIRHGHKNTIRHRRARRA